MVTSKKKARRCSTSPLSRSEVMSRVRAKDTGPEMTVRRAFWSSGLRYRLHADDLPGKPDLVFRSRRVAVFVHGCFWHGHEGCPNHRIPKTRSEWWAAKIARNRERDAEVKRRLEDLGWKVVVIWECETKVAQLVERMVEDVTQSELAYKSLKSLS